MGKIIGEQFKKYVANQINVRQKAHGSGAGDTNRTMDQLTYLNSKTAWVKLASGVRIRSERLKDENMRETFEWDTLAKQHVLFSGMSNLGAKNDFTDILQPRGTYPSTDPATNIWGNFWGTYNVNASNKPESEFGLVPMPGITSVDVKCMNRGSIRKATINLKCYSPEQFKIIDLLYLRLGYTVFLEYGNSLYLDNNTGKVVRQNYTLTESKNGFFSGRWKDKSYSAFLPIIEAYRDARMGNYDGMLAKVVNFSWTFAQDGSYDITLELISLGDVVESLKINTTPSYKMKKFITAAYQLYINDAAVSGGVESDIASSPANNVITAYLFLQKILLDSKTNDTGLDNTERFNSRQVTIRAGGEALRIGGAFIPKPGDNVINIEPIYTESENKDNEAAVIAYMDEFYPGYVRIPGIDTLTAQALMYASPVNCYIVYVSLSFLDSYAYIKTIPPTLELTNPVSPTDVVYFNYNTGEDDEDAPINDAGFYMRWGHLLQFINSNVISVIKGSSTNGKSTPLVYIDCETWSNKMYTLPYQVSLDPRVCIVKSLDDINTKKYYQEIDPFKNSAYDFAWSMNIYLSHNQIISSLNENMDEKGNVALFDFLNSLCIAVNKAMGGINNLEPFLNEDTNTLHIVDASYQPKPTKLPYVMQLYGYNKDQNQAGFVRNFNLKTEITNDFATMATIGSTAGGYVKGTENTMFSKWNKGLIDRWKEEYETPDPESRPKPGEIDEPAKMYVEEFWIKRYDAFGLTLMDLAYDVAAFSSYGDNAGLNDDIIDSNIAVVTEFYKYIQAKIQKERQEQSGSYSSPSNGFIPINLGITMDGISGVKIYNEINVNTSFLPNNYPESLRFIIKGVSHKLSDSDWETTLETVVISKSTDESNEPLTQVEIKAIMDKYIQEGAGSSGTSSATGVISSGGSAIIAAAGAASGAPGGAGGAPTSKSTNISNNATGTSYQGTRGTVGASGEVFSGAWTISQIDNFVEGAATSSVVRDRILRIAASYVQNNEKAAVYQGKDKDGKDVYSQNEGWHDPKYESKFKGVNWSKSQAWCAYFCTLVWKEAYNMGNALVPAADNTKWDYTKAWIIAKSMLSPGVTNITKQTKAAKRFIDVKNALNGTNLPKPGDIVIFTANNHVGILTKVHTDKNGKMVRMDTIEGNTSSGNANNGGETKYRANTKVSYTGWNSVIGFASVVIPDQK